MFARSRARRLFQLAFSLAIILFIAQAINWRDAASAVQSLNPTYMFAALSLFVPQTLVSAARWKICAEPIAQLDLGTALRQTLAASACNLVIPGKLGDLSKAAMISAPNDSTILSRSRFVVLEKIADVAALIVWSVLGVLTVVSSAWIAIAAPCAAWATATFFARTNSRHRYLRLAAATMALWALHLLQFYCLFLAAGVNVSWPVIAARVPWAIFAGLIPLTLFGIGTRDSALVIMFADLAPTATILTISLLTALRYVIPGLAGIPFLGALQAKSASAPDPQTLGTTRRQAA